MGLEQEREMTNFFLRYGISDDQRRRLWKGKIGNGLKITKEVFSNLLLKLAVDGVPESIERLIGWDMDRTFAHMSDKISDDGLTYRNVTMLMKLWHIYRPEIGYTQGMIYLATVLYLYFSEYETFKLFCNLVINRPFVFYLYKFNVRRLKIYNSIIWAVIQKKCPKLTAGLNEMEVNSEAVVVDWLFTLFTRAFDVSVLRYVFFFLNDRHVWDMIFCLGDTYIVKFCIALLMCMEIYVDDGMDSINVFRKNSLKVKLKS
jgi:hypothetical protein